MGPLTFTTVLTPDAFGIPELIPSAGKRVEIRVLETFGAIADEESDTESLAALEAEESADTSPVMSIEAIQTMLSCIPGNLSDEVIADREDR